MVLPSIAKPRTAVVEASFDHVAEALDRFRIAYRVIRYQDLEDPNVLAHYRTIFFPSGMGLPLEKRIEVMARHKAIESISFTEGRHSVNSAAISENIADFVRSGGAAYFSGFAYEFAQKAFHFFSFYDDFASQGLPGKLSLRLRNSIDYFCEFNIIDVQFGFTGWIAPRAIAGAEVLAESAFDTPRGRRSGPIAARIPVDDGEVFYSSYYNHAQSSDLIRHIAYHAVYRDFARRAGDWMAEWRQAPERKIIDAVQPFEQCREYCLAVPVKGFTVYFMAEKPVYQLDICDDRGGLIASLEKGEQRFFIDSAGTDRGQIKLRVFPTSDERHAVFGIFIAPGKRFSNTGYRIMIGSAGLALLTALVLLRKYVFNRRFSGRAR